MQPLSFAESVVTSELYNNYLNQNGFCQAAANIALQALLLKPVIAPAGVLYNGLKASYFWATSESEKASLYAKAAFKDFLVASPILPLAPLYCAARYFRPAGLILAAEKIAAIFASLLYIFSLNHDKKGQQTLQRFVKKPKKPVVQIRLLFDIPISRLLLKNEHRQVTRLLAAPSPKEPTTDEDIPLKTLFFEGGTSEAPIPSQQLDEIFHNMSALEGQLSETIFLRANIWMIRHDLEPNFTFPWNGHQIAAMLEANKAKDKNGPAEVEEIIQHLRACQTGLDETLPKFHQAGGEGNTLVDIYLLAAHFRTVYDTHLSEVEIDLLQKAKLLNNSIEIWQSKGIACQSLPYESEKGSRQLYCFR
jgi:hypothetical protein